MSVTHAFVDLHTGVRLHYAAAGPDTGPAVVLLHGFPDFWFGWREIIPPLAAAGFRVIAPDLRGFGLSDKPTDVKAYSIDVIVDDVAALLDALGIERAHVVGHDIGAGVAWAFAMAYPDRLGRLAVLNGPHPKRLVTAMLNPVQLARSWYVFLFQLPSYPEQFLSKNDYAVLVRAVAKEPTRQLDRDEIARYREAWSEPGALTSMLAYYRVLFRVKPKRSLRVIEAPVLVLWGDRDPHLGKGLAAPPPALVPDARVEHVADGTHWVQRDVPERVSASLITFLDGAKT